MLLTISSNAFPITRMPAYRISLSILFSPTSSFKRYLDIMIFRNGKAAPDNAVAIASGI
jgi:hypothetical protein